MSTPPANVFLPAFDFKVTVDDESVSFTEVTGLSVEYETATYRHGLSFWEGETIVRWNYPKYMPISLKKGSVSRRSFFYDWLTAKSVALRQMTISLCDASANPVVVWRIARAVPVKLVLPSFDANSNQVAVETLNLMVSGITLDRL